jgi:predicted nucleotidyltransferase
MSFNQRGLARYLKVSPTAIAKALKTLEKEKLVAVSKNPETKQLSIELNKNNPQVFALKRVENLRLIYDSDLVGFFSERFPGGTVILFGSYAFGEDVIDSDIDIAVIGCRKKKLYLTEFEKLLERTIVVQYYDNLGRINKNLQSNILNGITLRGTIEL